MRTLSDKIVETGRTGSFLLSKELAVAGSTVGLARKLGPAITFHVGRLAGRIGPADHFGNGIQPQKGGKEYRNST